MEAARDFRSQWPALGKLLIRDGALTTEQLEHALSLQRLKPGLRLGQVIVEQGYATSLDISRSVAEQHELEFVELELEVDRRRGRDDASRESRPSLPGPTDPPRRGRVDPGGGRRSYECRLRRRASPGDRDARATVRRGTRVHRGSDRPHPSGCRGPDRGSRHRCRGDPRIRRACWICSTRRPLSCSSTGSSPRRSTSALRTSTSHRSSAGSTFGSGSTGCSESSPRSRGRRPEWWRPA